MMRNLWKLAQGMAPWERPDPERVDGVAEGELEDVEISQAPGLIFTVRYRLPYEYQFEDDHHEEEISWGKAEVVGATFVSADDPQGKPKSVGGRILQFLSESIDNSFSDAFEEDIRADVGDSHSRRGRWQDEDDRRYDD